jgi:hypothetical protein
VCNAGHYPGESREQGTKGIVLTGTGAGAGAGAGWGGRGARILRSLTSEQGVLSYMHEDGTRW